MIRTLVIDDEEGIRNVITDILKLCCPNVQVVGEAASVSQGYELIVNLAPDLIFLDIELSGGTGFDILDRLEKRTFKTIFITAYNQYAIQAIKTNALDYILKPIDSTELRAAVNKFEREKGELGDIKKLLENVQFTSHGHRIAIPSTDRIRYLDVNKVVRCESEGTYTHITTDEGEKILSTKPLKEFENLLDGKGFFRIHKSHLVNIEMVKEFFRKGRSEVLLKNGDRVEVSKRKKADFIKAMSRMQY